MGEEGTVWRLPQGRAVDAVRWVSPAAALNHRFLAIAALDGASSLLHFSELSFDPPSLHPLHSWSLPSQTSSLCCTPAPPHHALLALASHNGTVSFALADLLDLGSNPNTDPSSEQLLTSPALHKGSVAAVDCQDGVGVGECVSVGQDGRINLVSLAESRVQHRCIVDNRGMAPFSSVRWASPAEFVTVGLGFVLQWWDHRRPGGAVSQPSSKWTSLMGAGGSLHTVDVHHSRKHICVAGGSNGVVLAWDLRWQQEPIHISGHLPKNGQVSEQGLAESDVWQVKYDPLMSFGGGGYGVSATKVPPVMMCSEDGILAVLEADELPLELLAEPCAINTFDIDPVHGTDVICGLEFESLLYLKRPG